MSAASTATQRAPGFVWILGALACFAVFSMLGQWVFGRNQDNDPRAEDRLANLTEVRAAQFANVHKMGLDAGNSQERLAKSLEVLKTLKPAISSLVVPGSPTQLKQAAAAPAPAAPAAAPAPAAPAK